MSWNPKGLSRSYPFHTAPERGVFYLEFRGSWLIRIWNEIGGHLSNRRWKEEVFLVSIQNTEESRWLQQPQVVFQSKSIFFLQNGEVFLGGGKLRFLRSLSEPAVALNEVQGKLGNRCSHIWCAINAGCHQPWSSLSSPTRFSLMLLLSVDASQVEGKVPYGGFGLGRKNLKLQWCELVRVRKRIWESWVNHIR